MGKILNLTGEKFNKLEVLNFAGLNKNNKALWKCKCDCGNEVIVIGSKLKSGNTKSCGCYNLEKIQERNTKHNGTHTRLYNIWCGMKDRCHREKSKIYRYYGAKGIKVCKEWLNNFEAFRNWALNNGYKENLTIDRKDSNKDYEPNNCRWITIEEQQRNKSNNIKVTINGTTKKIFEWAEIYSLSLALVHDRYKRGKRGQELFVPKKI